MTINLQKPERDRKDGTWLHVKGMALIPAISSTNRMRHRTGYKRHDFLGAYSGIECTRRVR
jgi:hypothetical protein